MGLRHTTVALFFSRAVRKAPFDKPKPRFASSISQSTNWLACYVNFIVMFIGPVRFNFYMYESFIKINVAYF